MLDNFTQFEQRKQDHIELALMADNQASELNVFDTITLTHEALPDFDFHDIDMSTMRFGRRVAKPFFISSMTAGHPDAQAINRHLLAACEEQAWAMGVGSQRRELDDNTAYKEWHSLKSHYPSVPLFSNLGISQVITTPLSQVQQLIDSLQAEALIIHCNPLQESIQPEGTPLFKHSWQALDNLVKNLPIPVIIKETGCGFSKATLSRLNNLGIAAVDISGSGGTHWGRIEGCRADDVILQQAAKTFRNWGIDTIQSIRFAKQLNPHYEVWGSGGVRNGLDAAKLFALGASMVGFAKLMLQASLESSEQVVTVMKSIEYELNIAMFCTGSQRLNDLKDSLCL